MPVVTVPAGTTWSLFPFPFSHPPILPFPSLEVTLCSQEKALAKSAACQAGAGGWIVGNQAVRFSFRNAFFMFLKPKVSKWFEMV